MKMNRFFAGAAFVLAIALVVGFLPACDQEKASADEGGSAMELSGAPADTALTDAMPGDGCSGCTKDAAADAMVPASADGCSGCPAEKAAGCGGCADTAKKECGKDCGDCPGDCADKKAGPCEDCPGDCSEEQMKKCAAEKKCAGACEDEKKKECCGSCGGDS